MAIVRRHSRKIGKGIAGISSLRPGPDSVKVGFPAGGDEEQLQKAIWNEFGTKGSGKPFKTERGGGFGGPIPERPFLRNAMRDNRDAYKGAMKKAAAGIIRKAALGEDVVEAKRDALRKLGVVAKGNIEDEIVSLSNPPNSPLTIELKGSDNPLIDTGMMKSSVSYKIEE